MPWINLKMTVDDQKHEIKIYHGMISGAKKLYVDDKLIFQETQFKDSGIVKDFIVGAKKFRLAVKVNFLTWTYSIDEIQI